MAEDTCPRLLSLKAVKDRTTLCEMTIGRMMARGNFPKPVKISPSRLKHRRTPKCLTPKPLLRRG